MSRSVLIMQVITGLDSLPTHHAWAMSSSLLVWGRHAEITPCLLLVKAFSPLLLDRFSSIESENSRYTLRQFPILAASLLSLHIHWTLIEVECLLLLVWK